MKKFYHDSCTYCKYNCHEDRLSSRVECNFRDNEECNIYLRTHFERISEEECNALDNEMIQREKYTRRDNLFEELSMNFIYVISMCILGYFLITAIIGIKYRFLHPDFTETQLFLGMLNDHPIISATNAVILLILLVARIKSK